VHFTHTEEDNAMSDLSTSKNLSRRHALRQFLTVAAAGAAGATLAPAAQAAVVPLRSAAASPAADQPSPIEKLWVEHHGIRRKYRALARQYDKQHAKLPDMMPKPHPSITESPENDAFGLKPSFPGYGNRLHGQIWSGTIEREIGHIKQSRNRRATAATLIKEFCGTPAGDDLATWPDGADWRLAHSNDPLPLTAEQIGRLADLESRLKLSLEYEQQKDRLYERLGLVGIDRGQDKAVRAMSRIEKQILKLPAQNPADTQIKIALYDRAKSEGFEETWEADSIMRDLRRMLKQQTVAA
jgi:hypothetical protein